MMGNRTLEFLYQDEGAIEAIAFGANERRVGLITEGYRDSGIPDFLIDLHPDTERPYCFLSLNFHKSYPVVIWGLRLLLNEERFDLPQAALYNITLAEAFSWAYQHFILEETSRPTAGNGLQPSLMRQVLQHALIEV